MVIAVSAENQAALEARHLVARDFVWFVVRDRDTGDAVTDGYWSGLGTITAEVLEPESNSVISREWNGAAGLIEVSDIPRVSTLTVQHVSIKLSQVSSRVNDLVRGYDLKQGRVEVYRGLYDPASRVMVSPALPRFLGFIDEAPITTPAEGQQGDVTLTCTSHTQAMTRSNSDTRSDASQRLRSATDNFFQDAPVVGSWVQFWGRASGAVPTASLIASRGAIPGVR